jgi:hypothetical protein
VTTGEQGGKLTAAKALFIGFFAAALGWAGVLVAAVAVATEQSWSKGRPERDRARERGAGWLDTQRSWLANDHRQRQARAQEQRDWLDAGADPDAAPSTPGRGRRVGAGIRRAVARIAVAGADFGRAFGEGWRNANEVRRDGGSFRDIAGARPDRDLAVPRQLPDGEQWADDEWLLPDLDEEGHAPVIHAGDTFQAEILRFRPGKYGWACRDCPGRGFDFATLEAAKADCLRHACTKGQTQDPRNTDSTDQPMQQTEGEPMTPTADSNAAVLAAKLDTVNTTVTAMTDDVDALAVISRELREKVTRAADLAHGAEMPTAAVVAVDAVQHAATTVDAHIDDFATATGEATDQLTAAVDGLTPVTQAEDKLHAAGATGRALDTVAV